MVADSVARGRRTRQFEHYLALMQHRTLQLVKSDCFLVFSIPAAQEVRPRIGDSETRIVQFAFMSDGFYLDLPDTSITLAEAKQLVSTRPEFRFALDKPQKTLGERQFDPVQRQYNYSQERVAAEDTAFVFFNLLQTPLDAWIKVAAASFDGSEQWERDFSMA